MSREVWEQMRTGLHADRGEGWGSHAETTPEASAGDECWSGCLGQIACGSRAMAFAASRTGMRERREDRNLLLPIWRAMCTARKRAKRMDTNLREHIVRQIATPDKATHGCGAARQKIGP